MDIKAQSHTPCNIVLARREKSDHCGFALPQNFLHLSQQLTKRNVVYGLRHNHDAQMNLLNCTTRTKRSRVPITIGTELALNATIHDQATFPLIFSSLFLALS